MPQKDIKSQVVEKAEEIAKILLKGKDCEVRKTVNGVSIAEISKKVVSR